MMNPSPKPNQSRFTDATELCGLAAALLLAAYYLVTSIAIASHRMLWFDEIVTVLFARLPDAVTIWKAVGHVDPWGMPAPYYIVVHPFQKLLASAEIGARLPSVLAVAAGLLITFDCTRRLTDSLHGLLAVALLTCSYVPYYGFEARAYGIYFMLAALSLWIWAHTSNTARSPAIVFGAVLFSGILMHPYAVLCLAPYTLWELRFRRPLRPSPKLVAGILGSGCAIAVLATHITAATLGPRHFTGPHPTLAALQGMFDEAFPNGLFLLALAIVSIVFLGARKPGPVQPASPAEQAGWLFLSIPLAGYLFAHAVTNAFVARYFIGMLPGIAVAFGCVLWRYFRETRLIALAVAGLLILAGAYRQFNFVRHPGSVDPYGQQTRAKQVLALEDALAADRKQFILLSGTLLYMEAQYYSKYPAEYRFYQTDDPASQIPVRFATYYPLKTWRLEELKQHARETAVVAPGPGIAKALTDAGFVPITRFTAPIEVLYFQ